MQVDSDNAQTPQAMPAATTAGLGLRRGLLDDFASAPEGAIDFVEVAPENWVGLGGRFGRQFRELAQRYPVMLHGLSLNIGGFAPLNTALVDDVKQFMQDFSCPLYTEHLTSCGDEGQLYDLMPVPFTEESVKRIAARIREVQDRLEQRIALENASYYAVLNSDPSLHYLSECEFINAVLAEADCDLLLDVNNIYVNSINHHYEPLEFLRGLPLERARYVHVAGHYDEAEDLKVDTHGAPVKDPVWALLAEVYRLCGPLPTLLERDFNYPPFAELLAELGCIRAIQKDGFDGLALAQAQAQTPTQTENADSLSI